MISCLNRGQRPVLLGLVGFMALFWGLSCTRKAKLLDPVPNQPPVILKMAFAPDTIYAEETAVLVVEANDPDSGMLRYSWCLPQGGWYQCQENLASGAVSWTVPSTEGDYRAWATVKDEHGAMATDTIRLHVFPKPITPPPGNRSPIIISVIATPNPAKDLQPVGLSCSARDPDNDTLSYTWSTTGGGFSGGTRTGQNVTWSGPSGCCGATYALTVSVDDGRGGRVTQTITVPVNP
jgi:hypothetical protein